MAKRRYGFDEAKIQRYLAEGRGAGQLAAYKPWLTIQDVPSSGRVSRISGWKTARIHHLLSDGETGLFLMFDWEDSVVDIREQFPLDREITRQIATDIGVSHPRDTQTQIDLVMTTDFVVDVSDASGKRVIARTFKPLAELDDKRVIEKFEIERRYWELQKVDWGVVTDVELPAERVQNLQWLHPMRSLDGTQVPYEGYWQDRVRVVRENWHSAGSMAIKGFCRWLEQTHGFQSGEGLTVIRFLLANKQLVMDLDREFDSLAAVSTLRMAAPVHSGQSRSA